MTLRKYYHTPTDASYDRFNSAIKVKGKVLDKVMKEGFQPFPGEEGIYLSSEPDPWEERKSIFEFTLDDSEIERDPTIVKDLLYQVAPWVAIEKKVSESPLVYPRVRKILEENKMPVWPKRTVEWSDDPAVQRQFIEEGRRESEVRKEYTEKAKNIANFLEAASPEEYDQMIGWYYKRGSIPPENIRVLSTVDPYDSTAMKFGYYRFKQVPKNVIKSKRFIQELVNIFGSVAELKNEIGEELTVFGNPEVVVWPKDSYQPGFVQELTPKGVLSPEMKDYYDRLLILANALERY